MDPTITAAWIASGAAIISGGLGTLSDLARQSPPDSPVHDQAIAARKAIQSAVDEATKADEALLDAIRADLHSRPSKATAQADDGGDGNG